MLAPSQAKGSATRISQAGFNNMTLDGSILLVREAGPTANHYLPVTPRSKNVGAGLLAKAV